MCDLRISQANEQEEKGIHQQLFQYIDEFHNLVFNAGAGAGKTYSLIESLRYILTNNFSKLNGHTQKVACITYTNAAVDEINSRLGQTDLVKVSTIHEMVWSFIQNNQPQLLKCHSEKMQRDVEAIEQELNDIEGFARAYAALITQEKESLLEELLGKKEAFYRTEGLNAASFKASFCNLLESCPESLYRNVNNFKKIVKKLYRKENYRECLKNIEAQKGGYTFVKYDARFNNDALHKMRFSHETLIEYAHQMFHEYDLLQKITIDSFPYILVDEYQDTPPEVIEILSRLASFSEQYSLPFFVGYFGDQAQHIYGDGVGSRLETLHNNLQSLDKRFNRRSTNQIINVINNIRNDGLIQSSIFEGFDGDSIDFFVLNDETSTSIESFIQKCKDDWHVSDENKLNCLVLTNKLLAQLSGFPRLYESFSSTDYYKRNFNNLNTELLSHDIHKLGYVPLKLFKLIGMVIKSQQEKASMSDVFGQAVSERTTFEEVVKTLQIWREIGESQSLQETLQLCFERYTATAPNLFKSFIKDILGTSSYEETYNHLLVSLNKNLDFENPEVVERAQQKLNDFLEVSLDEYKIWTNFILELSDKDVIFHTYHGTKGREFDNVLIIGQNSFGKDGNRFSNFFKGLLDPESISDVETHENTKNLLYVANSRAKKNLRFLYLDDICEFEESIQAIFGGFHYFNE